MRIKRMMIFALMALLLCMPVWAMANGSVHPWLLDIGDELWGPVPQERLTVQSFYNNGNILSRYVPQNGVLYHSYHGNPSRDAITDKTFTDVIIHPPKGTQKWVELYYEGVSVSDAELMSRIRSDLAEPPYVRDFSKGFPYYQRAAGLFDRSSDEAACTPAQLACEDKGNLRLAAWYDGNDELIRVDWIWETSDRFSIPRHDLSAVIFPTYKSESDVPAPVAQPSLVNPVTPFPMDFRLVAYRYPTYRSNAEFMELLIIDEYGNPEFDFEQPVVIYWPYPEGHGPSSKYHYQIKHYLDNTRTDYEILDAVPTPKGIRIATKTFSPFELSWTEAAESMQAVPAGRIQNVTLPAGVVTIGDPVVTDGKVSVRIDDDKTNWTEVLMKAASRDGLDVSLTVTAPQGATAGVRENFGADDAETLEAIAAGKAPEWFDYAPEQLMNNRVDGSAMFAEIRFGKTTYLEPVAASGAGTVICWENAAGQKQYEYVQWEISHSNASLREVAMPALSAKTLSPTAAALPAGVDAEIEMGGITCTAEDYSAFDSLPIVLQAPEGATDAVVYSVNGEETIGVRDGKVQLSITADSHPAFRDQIAPAQLDYTVAFVSGDGPDAKLHDFGLVSVWLLAKEKTPYPYYNQQGAKPVAGERLRIFQGKHQINNKIIYQETYGNAHLSKAGLNLSANHSGNIRMEVAAPEWAAAYGISESGGDFIYQTNWGLNISSEKRPVSSGETVTVYDQPLFKTVQAGRALVYLQQGITARYGGYVRAISWYDSADAEEPRLIEYLSITHDEFSEKVRNDVKKHEQDISEPVAEVTGVSQNEWQLVIRHDPQSGERAVHYDLHMEDERGVTHQLEGDTAFYMPYPDGLSYADQNVVYQIRHYSKDYQSYTSVPLEPTPYGLRFVEDHLSPFVLMWDQAEPTPPEPSATPAPEPSATPTPVPETHLPKTGDDTPFGWLLGMLLLSLAASMYLLRRKGRA